MIDISQMCFDRLTTSREPFCRLRATNLLLLCDVCVLELFVEHTAHAVNGHAACTARCQSKGEKEKENGWRGSAKGVQTFKNRRQAASSGTKSFAHAMA